MLDEIIEWLNEGYAPLTEEQVEAALQLDVMPRGEARGRQGPSANPGVHQVGWIL